MIRSMTGFGRKESVGADARLIVEMRAVNHRFLEVAVRLPKGYAVLEDHVKKIVSARVLRGRVDVNITLERLNAAETSYTIDWSLAEQYVQMSRQLGLQFSLEASLSAKELLQLPGVLQVTEATELTPEDVAEWLAKTAADAVDDLVAMKEREGGRLLEDITQRLAVIEHRLEDIHNLSPSVVAEYRNRLMGRIAEWRTEMSQEWDQQRILQEVLLFAERSDITEEITRLNSHCREFNRQLEGADAVGRKLDFLLQEMNREANTIASKANHLAIAHHAVEIKTELEKIREQVQNIE